MLNQPTLLAAGQVLLAILAIIAAVFDVRSRRIPNRLVLAGIVAGLAWNVFEYGLSGFARAGEGLGLGFILYFPLFLLRARGAGDVKLLAAIGTITGPGNCFSISFKRDSRRHHRAGDRDVSRPRAQDDPEYGMDRARHHALARSYRRSEELTSGPTRPCAYRMRRRSSQA